jgi:hypothetical protein
MQAFKAIKSTEAPESGYYRLHIIPEYKSHFRG